MVLRSVQASFVARNIQKTAKTTSSNYKATAINSTLPLKIANQVVKEADYVTGVKYATAYVSGKIIVIGLDLKANRVCVRISDSLIR
jgi:hypothetical protein